jgi:23S rRNA (cytidine1920-2'-O)/16S rRNA (cytidine1409-2'-O)-methyltransferase
MVKPQFEAKKGQLGNSGVVKNDTVRRTILKEFEAWVKNSFIIAGKADSEIHGARGNIERFYALKKAA